MLNPTLDHEYKLLQQALELDSDAVLKVQDYLTEKYGRNSYLNMLRAAIKELNKQYFDGTFEYESLPIEYKSNKQYFGTEENPLWI